MEILDNNLICILTTISFITGISCLWLAYGKYIIYKDGIMTGDSDESLQYFQSIVLFIGGLILLGVFIYNIFVLDPLI
ncbi:hypothetical protein CHRY9293_03036 [Chryseobacterium potabilaquae]|uniref:Uncharacterized protein n=1 Tax=Chryseobacterium potabilaquae TaxID=2675057 RepID=A0A6N4X885_9FLAO|nr:hypothetical protein CHRY9293_03036 [Chryseobacterium potabilaquae]